MEVGMPKLTIDVLARRRFLRTVPAAVAAAGGLAGGGRATGAAAGTPIEPDCFVFPPDPACWTEDQRLAKVWVCGQSDCPGYLYDPLRGEHTQDILPGTAFEDLPRDFFCPACGAPKSAFRILQDRATALG
jgi:rubredoxin